VSQTLKSFGSLIAAFALVIAVSLGFTSSALADDSVAFTAPPIGQCFVVKQSITVEGTATRNVKTVKLSSSTTPQPFGSPKQVNDDGIWQSKILFNSPGTPELKAQGLDESGQPVGKPATRSITIKDGSC